MSAEPEPDPSCDICERRLLPGERAVPYRTRDGEEASVCELCKPRAEAAGWLRPEEAEALLARGGTRERRRGRGAAFGGLFSRLSPAAPPAAGEAGPRPARGAGAGGDEQRGRNRPARPDRPARAGAERRGGAQRRNGAAPASPRSDGAGERLSFAAALAAFNASDHRRTVAGLTRTLGPPRATALAIRSGSGHPAVRLTVAWELTWYQWEVSDGDSGVEVRESGKGDTIDQLREPDRAWNLIADPAGTLAAGGAPGGAGAAGAA